MVDAAETLRRAAANKYERELVKYISRVVDSDPEAARKLAEMAARGRRWRSRRQSRQIQASRRLRSRRG